MNAPIDIRFWENEIETLLSLLQQAILVDIDNLMRISDHPETEDFCTLLAVLDERRNLYAKFSERLKRENGVTQKGVQE